MRDVLDGGAEAVGLRAGRRARPPATARGRATPGFPRSGTTGRRGRDVRRAAPAAPRSRRASSQRRPRRCRRPRTSRSRCSPTAHSGRRGRRGPARECRRPAPCRSASVRSRSSLTQVAVSASACRAAAGVGGRHREACAIAAEHEREFAVVQRVGHRDDHRRARHVHRLVAVLGDRLGRLHHVGHADHPAGRQRLEQARVHHPGEVAKQRQACRRSRRASRRPCATAASRRVAPGSSPLPDRGRAPAAGATSSVILPSRSIS